MLVKLKIASATPLAIAAFAAALLFAGHAARVSSAFADQEKSAARGQIDQKRLMAADKHPGEWLTTGRDFGKGHYSPLTQINTKNIDGLGFAWDYHTNTIRGLEATPIVSNGVIYTTAEWSVALALDARSGAILWTFDPKVNRAHARTICCDVVNRGVALYHDKVYLGTLDGRLIALDAKSGHPVWEVLTADQSHPYAITGAPRLVKGMVLIGNAGSEFGVRGYLSAYDAESGKLVWRTYTVPGDPSLGFESKALESAAKTWHGKWWVAGGGGTPWDSVVYDPDLDLIYAGTGIHWARAWPDLLQLVELTGIPVVRALREDARWRNCARVWPFETGLCALPDGTLIMAEVYPSLWSVTPAAGEPKDAAQVRTVARFFAERDRAGELGALFAGDPDLTREQRDCVESEEAWTLGVTARAQPPILPRPEIAPRHLHAPSLTPRG